MKLHDRSTSHGVEILWPVRNNGSKPPLKTVCELAEILGVSTKSLGQALTKDPTAPGCSVDNRARAVAVKKRWYEPRAVIAWWKQRSEVKA
jgi:hypothetical protein